jgi:hypothetical protein
MYKIMGADQREYGPVTSDAVREWIAQGRANAQTVASFEGSPWRPLSAFPEFADALRAAVPPPISSPAYNPALGQASNNLAVYGLVCSILGLCCMPLSLVGLGLCIAGLLQIRKTPQAYSTSVAIPIVGIVLSVFAVVMNIVALTSGAFHEMLRNLPR